MSHNQTERLTTGSRGSDRRSVARRPECFGAVPPNQRYVDLPARRVVDDEYLSVVDVARILKLNPQTVRDSRQLALEHQRMQANS
jgi:hypothetical protein